MSCLKNVLEDELGRAPTELMEGLMGFRERKGVGADAVGKETGESGLPAEEATDRDLPADLARRQLVPAGREHRTGRDEAVQRSARPTLGQIQIQLLPEDRLLGPTLWPPGLWRRRQRQRRRRQMKAFGEEGGRGECLPFVTAPRRRLPTPARRQ
ncbi:unnamed protein product [Protopolystoma xenopodis]|uniref:Uncharacterized protein n=1 Tax=Protopolystoma xenopodis TaxID=117903 RepID=A0A3S5BCH0_9PLAT|nr:unnamed protein product [Protopolystoma xenopodis]